MDVILCSVFLIRSQVTVMTATTTPPVTTVCLGASITITVTLASTSVGQTTLD